MRPRSRKERFEIFMEKQRRHLAPIFERMNFGFKRIVNGEHVKTLTHSRRIALVQGHRICLAAGNIEGCKRIQKELDGMDVYS